METTGTKHCNRCGRDLPLDEFHKNNRSKDGLQWMCKSCMNKANMEIRERKKEPSDNPLTSYTPRQLMEELARRGYKGRLTYTHIIDIENL